MVDILSLVNQSEIQKQLINEVKEKETAYKAVEKYKILAENVRDIILFINHEGRIIEANNAAIKAYGYSRDELLGLSIHNLRERGQRSIIEEQMAKADEHGIFFETLHRKKDGTTFHVQVNSQSTTIDGERILLSIIRDISERKHMEEQLEYITRHDYLTDIPNRYYLEEFLDKIYRNTSHEESALLFIDLDNFKIVNDSLGYTTGDKILIKISNCIKNNLRESDFFARLDGDEFAIHLPDTNLEGAKFVSDKLLESIEQEAFSIGECDTPIRITASIGITMIDCITEIDHLFSYANAALHSAKEEGKNRYSVLQNFEDKVRVSESNRILALIQDALKKEMFDLHFQPIYKTNNGILHYEVLVRMLDENMELVYPSSFIPLAERYGLMPAIDRLVVRNTLKILNRENDLNVFINLSGSSLGDDAFLEWIESNIKDCGINPTRIGFEITETTAIRNLKKAKRWIYRLKALGCRFALDDFGVGFSSFSHLHMLPVDFLKIDGSFVRNLDSDPTKYALVQAMNAVAHTLGKETIAEFVENEVIWRVLHDLGVDYGQGYYLGRPAPIRNINELC